MANINDLARARSLLAGVGVVLIGLVLRWLARGYAIRKRIRGFVRATINHRKESTMTLVDVFDSMARRTRGSGAISGSWARRCGRCRTEFIHMVRDLGKRFRGPRS